MHFSAVRACRRVGVVLFTFRGRSGPPRRADAAELRGNLGGQNLNVALASLMLPLVITCRRSLLLGTASIAGGEHGESDIRSVIGALEVDGAGLLLLKAQIVRGPPR